MDTYKMNLNCSNCEQNEEETSIPTGTLVKDFLKDGECQYCGCIGTLTRNQEAEESNEEDEEDY